jgi:hypothetical protein
VLLLVTEAEGITDDLEGTQLLALVSKHFQFYLGILL